MLFAQIVVGVNAPNNYLLSLRCFGTSLLFYEEMIQMKLNELTTPFETKQVITYAHDGNTVMNREKSLRHISDNIYLDKDYKIYVCYPDCPLGLYIEQANEDTSIEAVIQFIERNKLANSEQFPLMIEMYLQNGLFIKNTMIEFLKYIAPDKVPKCIEAKSLFLKKQAQKEQKQAQEEREKELAYVQQKNEEAQQTIQQAIEILKNGGLLINSEITLYKDYYDYSTYHIINHLARLYNIVIPTKTQGWINSSLAQVEIPKEGAVTNCKIFRDSNSSKVIFKYLNQLVEAVRLQ